MSILRTAASGVAGLAVAGLVSVSLVAGGQTPAKPEMSHPMPMGKDMKKPPMKAMTMTKEQKIANAVSSAPMAISGKATIVDWPAKEGEKPPVLKPGTNGWTCFPDSPDTDGNDPMCLDASWMNWIEAYLARKTPQIGALGIGYMVAPGGSQMSNTDPFAMAATASNHWVLHQPHLMIVTPDMKALEGVSTDPHNGGPYVMWAGTPYAHIMAPVGK